MYKSKSVIIVLYLLGVSGLCFGQSVFSNKETLYSTKNGSPIGDMLFSIEPKSTNANNNEWILTIGDKGNNFFESRGEKTCWIFNKKVNANDFKKEMKRRDYPVEVKDISDFMPFCENGIRFDLSDWEELRKQTRISFFINASTGQKVTLRLVFYISSLDNKKRTTIEDEAKVKIDFTIPDLSTLAAQAKQSQSAQGGELISLTEKIDPETAAKLRAQQNEKDSLSKDEAKNKEQRIALLNGFINDRNKEVAEFQEEVNGLLADKKTKVDAYKIDSLELIDEELKKKVDFWENGYSDILLTDEAIHDRFTKLRLALSTTSKKIEELKQNQNPLNGVMNFVKNNLPLTIGGGIVGLILLRMLSKMGKRMISKIKSKINSKISKMKSDAKNKVKTQPKKWLGGKKKKKKIEVDEEFENIDINDLAEI